MNINTLPALSASRNPRGMVKIYGDQTTSGEVMRGWVSWDIDNNTFYQADTFRVCFAISELDSKRGPDWWSRQKEVFAEIFAGFPADPETYTEADLTSWMYGRVDEIDFDPVAREITICGRDLTSVMIDTKTTEKFPNLTASEIAVQIAQSHSLNPVVTATTAKAGTYYEIDHVCMTDQRSEWDLLTFLAQQEGFVVYVKGRELHFKPQPAESDNAYVLRWENPTDDRGNFAFNGRDIRFSRNLTLAKGITVTVRSWNQKNRKGFTVSYPGKGKGAQAGKSGPFGHTQNYVYTFANLTPDAALQKAQALHKEITEHEVRMEASMPADDLLTQNTIVQVIGTGTSFDQKYYPECVKRSMSVDSGYTMHVSAKNHSPENQVTA